MQDFMLLLSYLKSPGIHTLPNLGGGIPTQTGSVESLDSHLSRQLCFCTIYSIYSLRLLLFPQPCLVTRFHSPDIPFTPHDATPPSIPTMWHPTSPLPITLFDIDIQHSVFPQ